MAEVKAPALAQVIGPWSEPQVQVSILGHLADGYRIVHMTSEKRRLDYVDPNSPSYHIDQHKTNSTEPVLVTYMAREKVSK
jgi:hypothetical protein